MKVLIVFFIVSFVIMILSFPFKTRLMCHINLLEMMGFYSLKIMRLKLLSGKIYTNELQEFMVENSVDLITSSYNKPFVKALTKELFEKIDVKKIEMYFTGGFIEDSSSSALMCGAITSFVQTAYSYLSMTYENVKLYEDVEPTFDDNNLEVTFDGVVAISFINIMISIVKAAINKKHYKNKEGLNERRI